MNATRLLSISVLLVTSSCSSASDDRQRAAQPSAAPTAGRTVLGFDQETVGALPAGWKVEGTEQRGPLATWKVIADDTAPSQPNVLALTSTNHDSGSTFNLCWTDQVRFQDGRVEISLKANAGQEDQGGGPIWRVQDKDNYYLCRANPLEGNLRVYYVKDGSRKQLATASTPIPAGRWHTIAIEQHGEHIVCSLDGQKLLEATDDHIRGAGGVGVWTKSDAASSFDDITIGS